MKNSERDLYAARVLTVLSRHVGRHKAIGMGELYEEVFRKPWANRINDTRDLRTLITELRTNGAAICSTASKDGPGYYQPSAGSEMEDYLSRLRSRALRALALEAKLRRLTIEDLLGQLELNLTGGRDEAA